jgi:hypothetical protein
MGWLGLDIPADYKFCITTPPRDGEVAAPKALLIGL